MKERLQAIHFWIGIVLCLPIVVIGLSGSAVVFRPEIEGYANPGAGYHLEAGKAHTIDQIVLAAVKTAPAGYRPMAYIPPADASHAPAVAFEPTGRQRDKAGLREVLIDPVTLHVVGTVERKTGVLDAVQELHSTLLAGRPGRVVLGWIGIAMFLLGITGLTVRLMWARDFLHAFSFKPGSRGFAFSRDLHGLTGMVGVIFFLAVTGTGIYMSVPAVNSAMFAIFAPGAQVRREVAPHFAPITHVAILEQDQSATKPGERFLASLGGVHSGEIGGLPLRIIVFITGLLPAVFVVTGLNMWWLKRKARLRPRTLLTTASEASGG